jgi:uncharacterized protein
MTYSLDGRVKPGHDIGAARQQSRMLPRGRLHLQDGPIDLIIGADGEPCDVKRAYRAAAARFATLLDELCQELELLRAPAEPGVLRLSGAVARRMERAVSPFAAELFITPMAAVAGAVAEEILEAMTSAAPLSRAYVNNGGDIALHLGAGAAFTIGLITRPDRPSLFGTTELTATDRIAGIATSGWRGRSFSLGIADAVTVLADSAADADAAATVIGNAVDLPGHPAIVREPACEIQPDSDLGQRLVTREVRVLNAKDILRALARGEACARDLLQRNLIRGCALHLQGVTKAVCADARHFTKQRQAVTSGALAAPS